MSKLFGNGNLGFWILGALFTLTTIFMQFDRASFQSRLEAAETWQSTHTQEVGFKEQQLWNDIAKMNVKINRLLKEFGYSDAQISELEKTATTYERK